MSPIVDLSTLRAATRGDTLVGAGGFAAAVELILAVAVAGASSVLLDEKFLVTLFA
jgi:hypothetical protein